MSFDQIISFFNTPTRIVSLIVVIALICHLLVVVIYSLALHLGKNQSNRVKSKWRAIWKLFKIATLFLIYFFALGRIIRFLDIPYTHYLLASTLLVVAFAVAARNLTQDIFSGISIIFSETLRIGQMVEINQHTGVVYSLGMRTTIIKDEVGAKVFIPNRIIQKVIYYPKGYLSCLVDLQLSPETGLFDKEMSEIRPLVKSVEERFPAVFISKSVIDTEIKPTNGRNYVRIKFKLWPGRTDIIESVFKRELINIIQTLETEFSDSMITMNFEIEKPTHKLKRISKSNGHFS